VIGNKVPGCGPIPAKVLICGEGPGLNESLQGVPFVGASGAELDWVFLKRAAKLRREDVYVTNIVKWRTDSEDSDPTPEDIARDEPELEAELLVVQPEIIVAVGKVAASWFLQKPADMERYYGVPVRCPRFPDKTLLVTYHPAAAMRQPERYYHLIYWAFEQLGRFVRGEIGPLELQFPEIVEGDADIPDLIAVDTEGSVHNPWGMSWSADPAKGYVVRGKSISLQGKRLEGHNLLYDVNVFRSMGEEIDLSNVDDTMMMAYLFPWLPRKLKPLMFKLCGMDQREYEEVIREADEKVAKEYIDKVTSKVCPTCRGVGTVQEPYKRQPNKFKNVKCGVCAGDGLGWPLPAPQLVFDGDSSGRIYKPRSLGRGIRAALERGAGLRRYWEAVPAEVRDPVEAELGHLREATLDDVDRAEAIHYSGLDACGTRAVSHVLKPAIIQSGLGRVYEIDMGILPIIDRMHTNGILLDRDHFAGLAVQFKADQQAAVEKLAELTRVSINPASPLQVSNLLFERMKLKPTKYGGTDEKSLSALKLRYHGQELVGQVIDQILEYRELDKLLGTYVEPLPRAADEAGRVHTRFLLHVTTSGRLSSRDPNLQNVPARSERGMLIRKGFIPKPGCSLVSVDLDQIELRVGAHLSEDANMIDIFRTGQDIHRATAARMFHKHPAKITSTERMLAKTVNFGIFYGMSAKRLMNELNLLPGISVTLDECVEFINAWFTAYPGIKDYINRCHRMAKELGYVESLFGRRRYLPGVYSTIDKTREESLRWSVNHPDQGTAAEILKIWLANIWSNILPAMSTRGYCEPLLTVHDEVIFEAECGMEQALIDAVVDEALLTMELLVPISAKGVYGENWSKLK
jgi:uracil-DNA glycosylase family 4